ncbi:MAG: YqgE/AlgH family protein [Candidatus Neomarinimicrobiota bacterium]
MGSLKNNILISMPHMTDPYFGRSVVYLCEHSADGAMGLVINKPLGDADLKEIFSPEASAENDFLTAVPKVYFGGPVMLERGIVLHSADYQIDGTMAISDQLCITSSKEIIRDIKNSRGPRRYRLMLGHAGWDKNQLEREIENGDWLVQSTGPDFIFDTLDRDKWNAAARSFGIETSQLTGLGGLA